jgi:hypothetical protein
MYSKTNLERDKPAADVVRHGRALLDAVECERDNQGERSMLTCAIPNPDQSDFVQWQFLCWRLR